MALPDFERLQDLITWDFTVSDQGQTSRYGTYAGAFYKQFLQSGVALPKLFPPKKIMPALYELAKKRAQPIRPA